MGRYVISFCASALLVGFVFLLNSLGMTGDRPDITVNDSVGPPEISFTGDRQNGTSNGESPPRSYDYQPPPPPPPSDEELYGKPSAPSMDVPAPYWSLDSVEGDISGSGNVPPPIHKPASYPDACRANAAETEKVTLAFTVNRSGSVNNVSITSSTNDCFNRAAILAVKKWQFSPQSEETPVTKTLVFQRTS